MSLQGGLIHSLFHARVHLPAILGVPSLCTYGQDTGAHRRPIGPTGQGYEPTYGNVETSYVMVMIRNTLAEIMKKAGVENSGIGPVEYGMESTTCRVVCVAVFCVAICGEIFSMETMARFLWYSHNTGQWAPKRKSTYNNLQQKPDAPPEDAEAEYSKWVEFDENAKTDKAKEIFPIIGKSSLDHVTFKCNGVTVSWKLFSWLMLVGRSVIVVQTFWNGLNFLMNTGGIVDQILNSLALIFIIDLDRLMFTTLARGITKDIMQRLEPLRVKPMPGDLEKELKQRRKSELDWGFCSFLKNFVLINRSTLVLIAVTVGGHFAYFYQHCAMESSPLDVTQWGSSSYFEGQTRLLGGWEFVFGGWYSQPTVDKYSENATCTPAVPDLRTHNISKASEPEGCGLPSPWSK